MLIRSLVVIGFVLLASKFVAVSSEGQSSLSVESAPAGGPTGQFIGPPAGNAQYFLGAWNFSWDGPIDFRCPCNGTIMIETSDGDTLTGNLRGSWTIKRGSKAILRGGVSYDQNVWTGRFEQTDDNVDFPLQGSFRLEARDQLTLTGSFQPDGTAIPFRWSGTRN